MGELKTPIRCCSPTNSSIRAQLSRLRFKYHEPNVNYLLVSFFLAQIVLPTSSSPVWTQAARLFYQLCTTGLLNVTISPSSPSRSFSNRAGSSHRLSHIPGPFGAKLSKLWGARLTLSVKHTVLYDVCISGTAMLYASVSAQGGFEGERLPLYSCAVHIASQAPTRSRSTPCPLFPWFTTRISLKAPCSRSGSIPTPICSILSTLPDMQSVARCGNTPSRTVAGQVTSPR